MTHASPWYADIYNYLIASTYPKEASKVVKEKLESDTKYYIWEDPYLWKLCSDQVICKCIPEFEIQSVLHFCHSTINLCCSAFYVWGINVMGPFPISHGNSYILLVVDYVSKWVEAKATRANDAKTIVEFVKSNIFYRFGVSKALISDQGSHFCNHAMASLLEKYEVVHRVTTAYHP
ncbi:Pro-Pol polyprotein, partial [Mucuna pruriens]